MGLAPGRHGFTLIELLMVVAIITTLMAMAMPIMGIAARAARRTATEAILNKVEAGLMSYGREMRSFPFQAEYPVVGPSERWQAATFVNRLGHFVATDLPAADADKVRADVEAATAAYRYELVLEATPEANSGRFAMDWGASEASAGPLAIGAGQVLWEQLTGRGNPVHIWGLGDPFTMDGNGKRMALNLPVAMMVNRLFQERARRAMLSGHLAITGTRAMRPPVNGAYPARAYPACEYDKRGTRVLAAGALQSTAKPGWAVDYLGTDLEPRARRDESIIDAWGNPLVYVHQLNPGIERSPFMNSSAWSPVVPFDTRFYGMRGRPQFPADLVLSPAAELGLDGRIPLSGEDCGWGGPTPVDPTYFPSVGSLLDSDMRYYAAPAHVRDFELWSAGPDGAFCWRRSDLANRDNIAARRYAKGLE